MCPAVEKATCKERRKNFTKKCMVLFQPKIKCINIVKRAFQFSHNYFVWLRNIFLETKDETSYSYADDYCYDRSPER